MKPKERFLLNIKERIKILQDAYDYNKNLPDDVFESLLNGNPVPAMVTEETIAVVKSDKSEEKQYGANKKLVREILTPEKSGLRKAAIVEQFSKLSPTTENAEKVVTNALSALSKDEEIERSKPRGRKIRGYLWKLKV